MRERTSYQIKLTVAVYREKRLVYRNEMTLPTVYDRRSECRAHVKKEIENRLRNSSFFISPRVDFDLVRYTEEASCNTYLRYRIMERALESIAAQKDFDHSGVASNQDA